jgi:hypothetical protein
MSVDATISMCLNNNYEPLDIIEILLEFGWTLNDYGGISYLPLGDVDAFNWQTQQQMTFEELKKIITSKQQTNEVVGIVMTWKDTLIGCTFLLRKNSILSIGLGVDRQIKELNKNYQITDFNWYLEKLLLPLDDAFDIAYFSCEHCY